MRYVTENDDDLFQGECYQIPLYSGCSSSKRETESVRYSQDVVQVEETTPGELDAIRVVFEPGWLLSTYSTIANPWLSNRSTWLFPMAGQLEILSHPFVCVCQRIDPSRAFARFARLARKSQLRIEWLING